VQAAGKPESPRLQRLRQLTFDRRPSVVLKAWSSPLAKPGEAKDEQASRVKAARELGALLGQPSAVSTLTAHFLATYRDPLDAEMAGFQRSVSLGDWQAVKTYLTGLPLDEGKAAYKQLLQSLQAAGPPQPAPVQMPGMAINPAQFAERNQLSTEDVLGLAAAAPRGLDRDAVIALGGLLRLSLSTANVVEHVVKRFQSETVRPQGQAVLTARQAAQILAAADQAADIGVFLPALAKAKADRDDEALNLLARHYLALYARDKKASQLEQAWEATQAALATVTGRRDDKEEALKRAVELAPKLKEQLGQAWLERSFTTEAQRGMDILATIGSVVAQGLQTQPMNVDYRLKELELQKIAVEALLKSSPARARAWTDALTLLAAGWLREAEFSYQYGRSSSIGPRMSRDRFGNTYFYNDDDPFNQMFFRQQQNMPLAIAVGDVLEARPDETWINQVDEGLRAKLAAVLAQLYLKGNDEAKAFPFIEKLAPTHPQRARELVEEFLRVWTQNHDPNDNRRHMNPFLYYYGFMARAESIPLTRSKQERNLVELAGWVERLRRLPVGELNEDLLVKAFTSSHSSAEVYRLEMIEKVFGPLGSLKPKTLAGLIQQMRENLAGVWREPGVQKDKKTNRKQKDIQAEVLRGYSLANAVLGAALRKFPDDWSLRLARAALLHDENNYRQEVAKSSEFAARRDEAFAVFQNAAERYASQVRSLREDEETAQVYEQWFYASLGACDLGHLTEERQPDSRQPALIARALGSLPSETAERHRVKFANSLFTKMGAVNAACKFNYLKAGFEIVGDHPQAREARKVYDYYKDLAGEIKLEAVVDGRDIVGYRQPFGVFVNLRHTREIERESGGFGRYLQNQNQNVYFSYNFGRPTADYRDKFQTAVMTALKDHFEVLSVTFQADSVNSRATRDYGWRVTPYAYLLLKARGPQVDKVPPLRMDLDFLDTSGYVVLPLESPAVPVDARPTKAPLRPLRKLQLTQTLDERQADKGKLILEIKATGLGLVPELDEILSLEPEGFDQVRTDDQGVSVARFDPDSPDNVVASERLWLMTLQARPGEQPHTFRFGTPIDESTQMTYQHYQDADLVSALEQVDLEQAYGQKGLAWLWWTIGGGVVFLALVVGAVVLLLRRRPAEARRFSLPERVTPFTVLGLLRKIRQNNGLAEAEQTELDDSIALVERHYFAAEGSGDVDLRALAEGWVRRAR
jgi:hypothetical protein